MSDTGATAIPILYTSGDVNSRPSVVDPPPLQPHTPIRVETHGLGSRDREDFLAYLTSLAGTVGKVRLIHGEREQALSLAETLRGIGFADVAVPEPGDRVVIG